MMREGGEPLNLRCPWFAVTGSSGPEAFNCAFGYALAGGQLDYAGSCMQLSAGLATCGLP